MKRIVLVVTAALVVAAMMVAMAMPAFAQGPPGNRGEGALVIRCAVLFGDPDYKGVTVIAPSGNDHSSCHPT